MKMQMYGQCLETGKLIPIAVDSEGRIITVDQTGPTYTVAVDPATPDPVAVAVMKKRSGHFPQK